MASWSFTTPFLPKAFLPTSNWGFIRKIPSKNFLFNKFSIGFKTNLSEIKERSATTKSGNISSLEKSKQNINQLIINQSIVEERIKVANRLVTYLEDSAKRSNLVKELATEFYDKNFYKNLI